MEILGVSYTDRKEAARALFFAMQDIKDKGTVIVGSYRGFGLSARFGGFSHELSLKGAVSYKVELGTDSLGNMTRIDHALDKLPERLEDYETTLANLLQQQEAAKVEIGKPFQHEEELRLKSARLAELDSELNIGETSQPETAA